MAGGADKRGVIALETVACPLCSATVYTPRGRLRDVALGVPGEFHVASCDRCGLLYQNPRVRADQLGLVYPDHYGPHARDPELSRTLRERGRSARWVLARDLGYPHVRTDDVRLVDRLRGVWRGRRFREEFPPWRGEGRLLDVGCASGRFLRQMKEIGWQVAGIEFDELAARKARDITPDVFVGDPMDAPFLPGRFDVVTAFHVIEHLPAPLGTLRRMLEWLAPGGMAIVEVPNVAGVGGRAFGRYWSGLDFPRHLTHFTPETMGAMVERAGGRVSAARHRTKPRYLIRSVRHALADRPGPLASLGLALVDSRLGRGAMKLVLEATLPLARHLRLGEAVRYTILPR
jgi:SAM-dependent methyltransferase